MTLAIILGNTGSVVWMPAVLPVLYWYMVCRPLSMTPLLRAARSGDLEDLRKQIEWGENVDQARGDGVTPLIMAAGGGHHEVVMALIAAGATSTWRTGGG